MKFVVIGVGGVGTHLVNGLSRFLYSKRMPTPVLLVDGDSVEMGNLARQDFGFDSIGMNKAEATANRLSDVFPTLNFQVEENYLTNENVHTIIDEEDIVFIGVDNYKTRKIVNDRAKLLDNVLLISGGNDIVDGDVMAYLRKEGIDLTDPFDFFHPEIAEPADKLPTEMTCQEASVSHPQLIMTNMMVANLMLNTFWHFHENNEIPYHEIFFDISQGKMRAREVVKDEK